MAHEHLHKLRKHELDEALRGFPPIRLGQAAPRVLELGAGTGYQALQLEQLGYKVTAVDLPSSAYAVARVFEVIDFDGRHLPFGDGTFDVVFSSNVLEHVADLDNILAEIRRVLAPGGVAIHVLPTPTWRAWTTLAHLPWVVKRVVSHLRARQPLVARPATGTGRSAWRDLVPSRHGERGNVLTEMLYFSRTWWRKQFAAASFKLVSDRPAGIFYTGCSIFGGAWGMDVRRRHSGWLGSACRIYEMAATEQ